jgi:hypothetical protein
MARLPWLKANAHVTLKHIIIIMVLGGLAVVAFTLAAKKVIK